MAARKLSPIAAKIRDKALSYPHAEEAFPWGEHAFKVKGRTFVFMRDGEEGTSFSVKLAASRQTALAMPAAEPTHYGMGAKGWVTLRPTARTAMKALYAFIDESFRAVAPARVLRELDGPL